MRWRWEWFATYTFARSTHPEAASKAFRVWVNMVNCELYGRNWARRGEGMGWVRGLEWQRRDVVHYHALVCGVRGALRKRAEHLWEEKLSLGFCRIYPAVHEAACAYISKYVVKGGEIDIAHCMDSSSLRQLNLSCPV